MELANIFAYVGAVILMARFINHIQHKLISEKL